MKSHFVGLEIGKEDYFHEDKIGGVQAAFSEYFNFKRIGVHYYKIPPGFRTSKPHAESLEEEFVYVIDGEIDLWLNGKIKKMKAGECIGFPFGTGIGHCFINNSQKDAHLFVAGDRTKAENKCRFLREEDNDKNNSIWWEDAPVQELGTHNGLPGEVRDSERDEEIFVFNGFKHFPETSFNYTGDSENFSYGVCLSRKFGLKSIAIWLERLPSGNRSSWPHAHSVEEEFAFILKGKASIWLDGEIHQKDAMTAVDFKAGSGIAHTIMNQSAEDIYYLCVGESQPLNDKIFYPQHPKRNEECKRENFFWENNPKGI